MSRKFVVIECLLLFCDTCIDFPIGGCEPRFCIRFKFLKNMSNFKIKVTGSKILVAMERTCPNECTCDI